MSRLRRRRRLSLESLEDRRVLSTITVAPVTIYDSAASSGATFTATLPEASAEAITLTYATSNGSAKAGTDYVATKSSVTIPAGQTSASFTVGIKPTAVVGKANEVFYLALKSSTGNTAASKVAATIVDDLPRPTVTISDVTVNEDARGGTAHASATVELSAPSAKATIVSYQTIDESATSSGSSRDYKAAKGSVTIKPGATSATIPLTIYDRATTDKTFDVELIGAAGGRLKAAPAGALFSRVVIHDTKSTTTGPALGVSSPIVLAGDVASFDVTLSSASALPVSVRYFSVDGTATTSGYSAVDGVLTIPAGQTTGVIAAPTLATTTATAVQQFQIDLTSPSNATLASRAALGTIVNTSAEPTVSVTAPAPTASPMPGANPTDDFTVSLSTAFLFPVTVNYATVDGTALAGTNYTATSGTLTFAPGVTSLTVPVTLFAPMGGPAATDETFGLALSSPTDATIATGRAVATISASTMSMGGMTGSTPGLTVGGGTAVVGSTGSSTLTFTVTLANASTSTVTVDYATADGTAVAGTDYTAASGVLTFAPGVTTQTVAVTVLGETTASTDKTFTLNLSNPSNAQVTNSMATGDILYATGMPSISVAPASTYVGTTGDTASLLFNVSLSAVSANNVTVQYATADGTAVAGADYTSTSGTLTFTPGMTSIVVTVPVTPEASKVLTKTLTLNLAGASGTSNATASAVGTLNYVVSGQPNDLSDNLPNASGGVETATGSTVVAASFATGPSGFTLNSATLLLDQATAGTATVAIYSDGGLQPGTLVGTLTSPTTYATTPTKATFTSVGGIALAANATYWVVLTATAGAYDWSWSSVDGGTGIGVTDAWAESADGSTTWFPYNTSPPQMQVIATAD